MCTPEHTHTTMYNSIVPTENGFRGVPVAVAYRGKRSDQATTMFSGTSALSPFNTELWAAVFTFNPYLLISINELMISIIHLLISINELLISINELLISINGFLISINTSSSTVFIDINNSFIDINKGIIDINNSFIDINKYG